MTDTILVYTKNDDLSARRAHEHALPAIDATRDPIVEDDGCRFDPEADGTAWVFTPGEDESRYPQS